MATEYKPKVEIVLGRQVVFFRRRRKDDTWGAYRIRFSARGGRVDQSTRRHTLDEARREAERIVAGTRGTRTEISLTLEALFQRWTDWTLAQGKKTPKAAESDLGRGRRITKWLAERKVTQLGDLNRELAEDMKADFLLILSPKTVNNTLTVLRAAIRWAIRQGYVDEDPVRGLELLPQRRVIGARRFVRAYSDDELHRILQAAERSPYRDVIVTAAWTGLRRGELVALKVGDVQVISGKVSLRIEEGKSAAERIVPMKGDAAELILRLASGREPTERLFRKPGSQVALDEDLLSEAVRAVVEAAGITDMRQPLHALRHTFGTHLVRSGAPLPVIQRIMGHSDVTTTMQYVHVAPVDAEKAIEALSFHRTTDAPTPRKS